MEIRLSNYLRNKAEKFAEDRMVLSQNLYKWRGEVSLEKMKEDIIVGWLGEYAVYRYIKNNLELECTKPDSKIYKKSKKSFGADLRGDTFDIHVKSQSINSVKRYGNSWLLQRSDSLVSAPDKRDYFAFTEVDLNSNLVTVLGFAHVILFDKFNLWSECKVPKYRHSKVALYLSDIKNCKILRKKI